MFLSFFFFPSLYYTMRSSPIVMIYQLNSQSHQEPGNRLDKYFLSSA